MIAKRALPAISFSLLALLSAACSSAGDSSAPSDEGVGQAKSAVINGKPSDSTQDSVVLIVNLDRQTHRFGQCTGTLLAPNLVLTARHCVADTDEYAACDAEGNPIAAGVVRGNFKADTFYIYTGKNRPATREEFMAPAGQGAKILDDGGKNLCNHDIALIVLKEPIANMPISPIRLDAEVEKGEKITAVGWGVTETTPMPDRRQQRTGITIDNVGPDDSRFPVPANEFEVGEAICSGDSGGPALASTGAVVGIVSRGGNASGNQDPNDPAANCIDGRNLYTKVSPFKDLILGAFELVEAEPWLEGGPDPRKLKPASACTEADECRSGLCLADPDQAGATTCAADCSVDACPEGQVCTAEGDAKVCRAPTKAASSTTSKSGCAASPASSGSGATFALAALAIGLVVARRRRSR